MGQFYVPELGDQIRLVSDWTFTLFNERRNYDVWEALAGGITAPAISAWAKKREELQAEVDAFKRDNFHEVMKPYAGFMRGSRMVHEPKPGFEEAWEELRDRL